MNTVDLLIIGAGPAGLAAAEEAGRAGLSVWLIDEHPRPGGQIYRDVTHSPLSDAAGLLGSDYLGGKQLAQAAFSENIRYLPDTQVWQVSPEKQVDLLTRGHPARQLQVQARFILLCVGALERPLPLPGWTLPGAMTVGAAQLLVKSAGLLPPDDGVLIGNGPLLLLFAAQISRAGGHIQAIIETTSPRDYWRALPHLPAALCRTPDYLFKGWRLRHEIRQAGIPWFSGVNRPVIHGQSQVEAVEFTHKGTRHRLATHTVLSHAGVIPATNLALALGCRLRWDARQQYWVTALDTWQQASQPGIYVAGDAAGIIGAQAAVLSGKLAALAIIQAAPARPGFGENGRAAAPAREIRRQAARLRRKLRGYQAIRPFLSALYPPPSAAALDDEVTICRCEQVSAGDIRAAAREGCGSINDVKSATRCGMGRCQGRMCGHNAAQVLASQLRRPPDEAGYLPQRFPLKPVTLRDIADSHQ